MTAVDLDALDAARAAATREDRAIAEGLVRRARAAKDGDERDAAREAIALEIATERALAVRERDALRAAVEGLAEELESEADSADDFAQNWLDNGNRVVGRDRLLALAEDRRKNAARLRATVAAALTSEGERE